MATGGTAVRRSEIKMAMKPTTWAEAMMQHGNSCNKFKWRRERLESGSIVYRRVGQRDPKKAIRVIINPVGKDKYEVFWRNASWFDFLGEPNEQRVSSKDAEKFAKKHMTEGFCYD
jgi:hypothetical protein